MKHTPIVMENNINIQESFSKKERFCSTILWEIIWLALIIINHLQLTISLELFSEINRLEFHFKPD